MSNLDLMRKRIQHNQKKQEEDYRKEYNLRQAKGKGASVIAINNIRIQNFVEERGIEPLREVGATSYYLRTAQLLSLLEDYEIENYIIKNKQ